MRSNLENLTLVAGMPRTGTTFLYHNLSKHPSVFVASRKELCYFAHNYRRGEEWFTSFFSEKEDDQAVFDICGLYFLHSESYRRIEAFQPGCKVVIGVREPLDWSQSLYLQYHGNFDVPPYRRFLKGCSVRREARTIRLDLRTGSIQAAIERFMETFQDRLLLYHFRALRRDPLEVLRAIEAFTGLPPYFRTGNFENSLINATGRRRLSWFDRLLQRRAFVDSVIRWVPRGPLLWMRGLMDRHSAPTKPARLKERFEAEDVEFAREHFAQDREFVESLFGEHDFVLGNRQQPNWAASPIAP